jgi:hypothetical protein
LENLGVDGRIILSGCTRSGMGDVDWIDLDQGRDMWHFVNSAVDLRVAHGAGTVLEGCGPLKFSIMILLPGASHSFIIAR